MANLLDSLKADLLDRIAILKSKLGLGPVGAPFQDRFTRTPGFILPAGALGEGLEGLRLPAQPSEYLRAKASRGQTTIDPAALETLAQIWADEPAGVINAVSGPGLPETIRHEASHQLVERAGKDEVSERLAPRLATHGKHVPSITPGDQANERIAYASEGRHPTAADQAIRGDFMKLLRSLGREDLLRMYTRLVGPTLTK